jgi:phage-related protein
MANDRPLKDLFWLGNTKSDLSQCEGEVKEAVGFALYQVQLGLKPLAAKPLKGHKFKGAKILEIVTDFDGDTWRTVYTVEFKEAVYVVHFFQKKSKKGIATPQSEINLIKQRLVWLREQVKAEAKRK